MSTLYHFTDTARLPWILLTRQLEPGRNQVGGYPVDFLWATTNARGDATSTVTMNQQNTSVAKRSRAKGTLHVSSQGLRAVAGDLGALSTMDG
jgi:hypothetical protein